MSEQYFFATQTYNAGTLKVLVRQTLGKTSSGLSRFIARTGKRALVCNAEPGALDSKQTSEAAQHAKPLAERDVQ